MINFPKSIFSPGQVIFDKGDSASALYMIESGQVEIFDPVTHTRISVLDEGESFGEQAILVGGVRAASAKALTSVSCLEITTARLREMLDKEESLLRPTIEALLLQLCMHNEIISNKTGNCKFEVSEQFSSNFYNPALPSKTQSTEDSEFSKDEMALIHKEIDKEKTKIIMKSGESLAKVYDRLLNQKMEVLRAKKKADAERIAATGQAIKKENTLRIEDLPEFLASEKSENLTTVDKLYLKLLMNRSSLATGSLGLIAFAPGKKIISQGDFPDKAYIITQGEATYSSAATGYSTLGPGAVIGLAEGLADLASRCESTAVSAVVAMTIPTTRALSSIRGANSGLLGIARLTAMRVLDLSLPPESLKK